MTAIPMPQFGWQPQLSWPQSAFRSVNQIGPVREGAHERDREPVAGRLAHANLVLHVVRQVRKRVALRCPAFRGNLFVAARKRNRLEGKERNLLRVIERELDHAPTCSLLTPLMIVMTGTISTPFECRFSIARSFTSNRLPMARCELAALPTPSNCRYA